MNESNYLYLTIAFNKPEIPLTQLTQLENDLIIAIDKGTKITDKYDYVPEEDDLL